MFFPEDGSIPSDGANKYPKIQSGTVLLTQATALLLPSLQLPDFANAAQCVADIASIPIEESLHAWCCTLPSIARASESRKREFVAGRQCAQNAMAQMGKSGRVGVCSDRSPAWPKGIVGSISHTNELVWAAVASSETTLSLGIDAEIIVDSETADELLRVVATENEIRVLESLTGSTALSLTLAFSAKESVYKCIAPLGVRWLDFLDVEIRVHDQRVYCHLPQGLNWQTASARIDSLAVDYEIHADHVFTFCTIPNRLARDTNPRVV